MKDFLIAMAPIVGFWTLPLLPLIYTTLVTVLESTFGAIRWGLKASRNAEKALVKAHPFPHVDPAAAQELST